VERKAILVLDHLNRRDPWVIFDEYKLISQIDSTLIERALRITESNPGIMSVDMLLQCLTPLSNSLPKDVLLNILHHFKITEVMAHGNDTKYFLPSVLKISPSSELPLAWNLDDGNYTLGFAQCILPQSNQLTPVFMPHFLYFMLYELFVSTENSDFDSVVMSHSALYVQLTPQLQIYVTIDSSAIILHMRCSESGVFTCLQYRNQFESIIHQQRALLQPNLKITEYIVPMEGLSFPIKKIKYVHAYGIQVNNLKNVLTKKSNSTTTESLNKLRSFEPYEWLSKLQKEHLDCLLDPRLTNVEVSKAFFRDLAKCVGGNWKTLLDYSELLQDFETNTSSDPEEPSGEDSRVSNQHPTYGRLFELFSSMSIFQTTLELISALKDPKEYDNVSTPNESTSENESQATAGLKLPAVPVPEEIFPQADSLSYLPPSSTSSSVSVGPTSHDRVHMANPSGRDLSLPSPMSQPDTATLKTCSTSSDASSITSMGMRFNVPTIQVGKALVPMSDMPQNVQFVTRSAVLQCGTLGGRYQDEVHNISFTIPPQAVREGTEIKIEFAIAVLGPFTFPEGITPVSPVLWVRLKRENSQEKLLKPIEIGIHHAVNCSENSKLVQILCTQNQTDSYSFTRTHKLSKIWPGKGMLCTKLSKQQYFFCIAAKRCQEVVARTQYCVVKVAPRHTSCDYSWKLYFFITYALPACVEMVRQQFGEEYVVQETGFQFDTSLRGDPSVTLEYQRVTPQQWTLTKEGTCRQIEASKVEFGNVSSFQMNMNRYHMYPPNFTITASGHQATGDSIVEFEFKGVAQTELLYEVALIVPRKATIVSMSSTADDTFTDGETENSLLTHVCTIIVTLWHSLQ
jgi:hypothetical protein